MHYTKDENYVCGAVLLIAQVYTGENLQACVSIFVCGRTLGGFCFLTFSEVSVFSTMSTFCQAPMNQYCELDKTDFMFCLDLMSYCQSIQLNDGTIQ